MRELAGKIDHGGIVEKLNDPTVKYLGKQARALMEQKESQESLVKTGELRDFYGDLANVLEFMNVVVLPHGEEMKAKNAMALKEKVAMQTARIVSMLENAGASVGRAAGHLSAFQVLFLKTGQERVNLGNRLAMAMSASTASACAKLSADARVMEALTSQKA